MDALQKLADFFKSSQAINYKKGEMILRAQDEPPGVFYLKRGYARLYSLSKDGEELTLIIFKPQDFFPYMWVINKTPNYWYVEAMTAVEVWRAPREEFLNFLKDNSEVFFELTGRILVRLEGLLRRMEYLAFGNAHAKVASIILICAERFGKTIDGRLTIDVPLTHKDIANLVGVARETASIELKKMERKGLIFYQGRHLVIKDKKGLESESLIDGEI